MSGANVETQALVEIRRSLTQLQNYSNNDFYKIKNSLEKVEAEVQKLNNRVNAAMNNINSKLKQLEKKAEEQREIERNAEKNGEKITRGLPSSEYERRILEVKNKQKKLMEAKKAFEEQKMAFKASEMLFLEQLNKAGGGSGGTNGTDDVDRVVEKSITKLDDYVNTNFGEYTRSTYNYDRLQEMRMQNEREQARRNYQQQLSEISERMLRRNNEDDDIELGR